MSNLVQFAQTELDRIADSCKSDAEGYGMQKAINKNIMDIIKTFSEQGHTGTTAGYTIALLNRLLNYKPITPLTGEDDEWTKLDYGDNLAYQNKRCPSVFKDSQGRAYDAEAKVFSDDNGHTWYTNRDSSEYITFPYDVPDTPQSVIIDNKEERLRIQEEIKQLINEINGNEILGEFTEESYLKDFLDTSLYTQLQDKIIEKYNITKILFTIKDDETNTQIWEIVNLVLNSDKEDD